MPGIQRPQYGWVLGDPPHPERAHHHEPERHDRPERLADLRAALGLKCEQPEEHCHGGRQYVGSERRRDHLQALERGEHRDRRRDGTVAVDQGGAEQADRNDGGTMAAFHTQQGHQGQNAAFAVVVDAHREAHVLDPGDNDQRPDHQRQRPEHGECIGLVAREAQHRLQGVQRAGTDIPEHHAERGQAQRRQACGNPGPGLVRGDGRWPRIVWCGRCALSTRGHAITSSRA